MSRKTIEAAWRSFYEDNKKTTIEEMRSEGWKTLQEVANDCGLSRVRINHLANEGKLKNVKRKVFHNGKTRGIIFVMPLL